MSALNSIKMLLVISVIILLSGGCASFEIRNERAVSTDDVIKMSGAGAGVDVIISQIEATHSTFRLTPDEIVMLKEAGVQDDVIEWMIDTGAGPELYDDNYYPWDNWITSYNYYGYRYHYPYYPGYNPAPYVVYREPGLVGRFYRYAPLGRSSRSQYRRRYDQSRRKQDVSREE